MKRTKSLLTTLMLVTIAVFIMGCPNEAPPTPETEEKLTSTVEMPEISPAGGTFSDEEEVTITTIDGARVHYTINGDEPTVDSPTYMNAFLIGGNTEVGDTILVKAIAVKTGSLDSEATEQTFKKIEAVTPPTPPTQTVETPRISPPGGTFSGIQKVTIDFIEGARIYYTINGDEPTSESSEYTGEFSIGENTMDGNITVKAIAIKEDWHSSAETKETFMQKRVLATVLVKKGIFSMGSLPGGGDNDEKPQHNVTLTKSYYMGESEVTQSQYKQVMYTDPSYSKGGNKPVEQVTWNDAVAFCNALSEKEGLTPYYRINGEVVEIKSNTGLGYRLPTEAEWEYAAGGGNGTRTKYAGNNNNAFGASDFIADYAVHGSEYNETAEVKTKKPNDLGLYDMSGNVAEWCWDMHASYKPGAVSDPTGASTGARVVRGGTYFFEVASLRVAKRDYREVKSAVLSIGFRVVRFVP